MIVLSTYLQKKRNFIFYETYSSHDYVSEDPSIMAYAEETREVPFDMWEQQMKVAARDFAQKIADYFKLAASDGIFPVFLLQCKNWC